MKEYVPPGSKSSAPQTQQGKNNLPLNLLKRLLSLAGIAAIITPLMWVPALITSSLVSISVTGNQVLTANEVISRFKLQVDENWLDIDPFELETLSLVEPWIESIDLKKESALGLQVHINERSPIAYVRAKNGLYFMDHTQMILTQPKKWTGWDLPVISARNLNVTPGKQVKNAGIDRALELMVQLKEDPVIPLDSISEIRIENPMNLSVVSREDGLLIKLGFDHFEEKLTRLHLSSQDLNTRKHRLSYIDLRHPYGVVIKRKE